MKFPERESRATARWLLLRRCVCAVYMLYGHLRFRPSQAGARSKRLKISSRKQVGHITFWPSDDSLPQTWRGQGRVTYF